MNCELNLECLNFDVFASNTHNLIFLNVQEGQNTNRNTFLFTVFDVDKLHF